MYTYIYIFLNIPIIIYTSKLQQVSKRGLLGPERSQLVTCWRVLVCNSMDAMG